MSMKYTSVRAIAFLASFVLTMGAGSAYAMTIGTFGSAPTACPDIVPYCPYGGHVVTESNGCTQTVCNTSPAPVAPTINAISPGSGALGSQITLTGSGLNAKGDEVYFDGVVMPQESYEISNDGQTLTFVLTTEVPFPAGTYNVYVVNANGTSNTESFTVTASATSSAISVYPTSLNFTAIAGSNPSPQQITIYNVPSGNFSVGVNHTGNLGWLTFSLATSVGFNQTRMVYVNTAGLSPGTYTDESLVITGNNQTITIPVTLTVTASPNSPSIAITSPSAGAQVPAGSSLTVNYSTSGSFSAPGGIYFVYLKEKPNQLLGNNSISNTYNPLIFRASSLPYPLTVTMPTVADGWSGPAYLEIDYADNNANVIASATSGEFTITNPDSQNPGSSPSGYPELSSFTVSPNSIASGQVVAVNYAGTNLSTVNLSVTCPFGVSSPDGHGGDSCGRTSTFVDGANSTQLQFINSGQSSQQVEITLSAYDASDSLVGTKSAYVTVGSANASITPGAGVPSGTSNASSSAQAAIRQQLVQLIALLLQLLQQYGAQGLVSSSQLNSILGTTSK